MRRGPAEARLAAWQAASPLPELLRSPSVTGRGARVAMLDTGADIPLLLSRHPSGMIRAAGEARPAAHGTLVADILLKIAPGIDLTVVDDPRCVALMERLQREKPDLWAEDIGE